MDYGHPVHVLFMKISPSIQENLDQSRISTTHCHRQSAGGKKSSDVHLASYIRAAREQKSNIGSIAGNHREHQWRGAERYAGFLLRLQPAFQQRLQ